MVVAIISMLAVLLVPRAQVDERLQLNAATSLIVSDIELAQVMNISNPKNPVVIRFDGDAQTYWLAPADKPDQPIFRSPTQEPYIVTMGQGRAVAAAGVVFEVEDIPHSTLRFSPHGSLATPGIQPRIRLRVNDRRAQYEQNIAIAPITGSIQISQQAIPARGRANDRL